MPYSKKNLRLWWEHYHYTLAKTGYSLYIIRAFINPKVYKLTNKEWELTSRQLLHFERNTSEIFAVADELVITNKTNDFIYGR